MVFKIPHGTGLVGYTGYYDLYTSTDSYNENSPTALQSIASGSLPYKSSIINEWNTNTQAILAVNILFLSSHEPKVMTHRTIQELPTLYILRGCPPREQNMYNLVKLQKSSPKLQCLKNIHIVI